MPELYISDFSYKDYLTYKIKEGDTPDSVAATMGIDTYRLRNYHNRYAPLEDCIGPVFPRHLEFLIIKPPEVQLTDEEKEQHRKYVVFNDSLGKLSLNYSQGEHTYGVLYTIENGQETQTLKHEIKVIWLAQDKGYHFYKVIRGHDMYVNDTAVNTMAEKIAHRAGQALYPLIIVVDEDGQWVDIYNFHEIKKRWQEAKTQISKYYKGHFVEKYFSIYDKNLKNKETLFLTLDKDWFLNALFNGIHIQYPPTKSKTRRITFPYLAKAENLTYTAEQVIDERLDVDNLIVIDINGKLDDLRTKTNFENELNLSVKEYSEEKITGNYKAKYFLNPNNYMPEAFIVSCDLALDNPQKYNVTVTNVHNTKKLVVASRQPLFISAHTVKQKSGSSFWYFFIMSILLLGCIYAFIKYYQFKFK